MARARALAVERVRALGRAAVPAYPRDGETEPGPSTLAACPPGSLASIYEAGLTGATNYAFAGGNLVLTTTDGTMTFS